MEYKDALAACLDAIRDGEDPQIAAAAYPGHAARLLEDARLVASVRGYAAALQPGQSSTELARQRLNRDLASLRSASPVSQRPAPSHIHLTLPRFAFAAAAAVAAIAVFAFASGVISQHGAATADGIEGVLVEKSEARLLLQTEDGLQSVDLTATSSITDEAGAALSPVALEPGQVVSVQAKRQDEGALRAVSVQRRPAASLADWCRNHPVRCQEVEKRLPDGVVACRIIPSACPASSPQTSSGAASPAAGEDRSRLAELTNRCQRLGGSACEELRHFCRAATTICAAISGWVRTILDLPEDLVERKRLHTQRCRNGSILDCRELRLVCERLGEPCPLPTPRPRT